MYEAIWWENIGNFVFSKNRQNHSISFYYWGIPNPHPSVYRSWPLLSQRIKKLEPWRIFISLELIVFYPLWAHFPLLAKIQLADINGLLLFISMSLYFKTDTIQASKAYKLQELSSICSHLINPFFEILWEKFFNPQHFSTPKYLINFYRRLNDGDTSEFRTFWLCWKD